MTWHGTVQQGEWQKHFSPNLVCLTELPTVGWLPCRCSRCRRSSTEAVVFIIAQNEKTRMPANSGWGPRAPWS